MTKKEFHINEWLCMQSLVEIESQKIKMGLKSDLTKDIKPINVRDTKPGFLKQGDLSDNFYIGLNRLNPEENILLNPEHSDVYNALYKIFDEVMPDGWILTKSWAVSYNRGSFIWPHDHKTYAVKNKQNLPNVYSGVLCLISSPGDGILRFEDNTQYDQRMGDVLIFDSTLTHWCDVIEYPKTVMSFDLAAPTG